MTNASFSVDNRHREALAPIATPDRLLLGPGPSKAHPTVLDALARTPIGHLDPLYVELMSEVQELLRYAWQTDHRLTLPMSGTGSAAMEATIANMSTGRHGSGGDQGVFRSAPRRHGRSLPRRCQNH